MDKRIRERYNESILDEARRRYAIAPNEIRLLDGFESYMYEFERGGERFILRIGHSFRRSPELIRGEVDWLNYLCRGGAGVARAVLSAQGNLVELIPDGFGEHFLATAFIRAPGRHMRQADATPSLFAKWGELMGRMHRLSKDYEPPDPAIRRMEWDDPNMSEVERLLPPSESMAVERYRVLMAHLHALPKDRETYGLIHQDAHAGNFFLDPHGCITLFDFDDCCYSWYMNDIAIVLFYAVMGEKDEERFVREFMARFLTGYRRENSLAPVWLQEIPHFLKLRELELYAVVHRSFDVEHIDNEWVANFMLGRQARIEAGAPFVEFNWKSLEGYLK